ncbi:MAG TPA: hypothetical protein PLV85_04910 [Polyangiaceae bacterium]|nr:hypothetical protein [Polyangiaceae bacterium]
MKMNHAGIGLIAGLGLALLFVGCSDDEESVDGTQNPAGGGGSGGTAVDASAEGAAPDAGVAGTGGKPTSDGGGPEGGEPDSDEPETGNDGARSAAPANFIPSNRLNCDGLTDGEAAVGISWGNPGKGENADTGTYGDTSIKLPGRTSSCKLAIKKGSTGRPGDGADSTEGDFGFFMGLSPDWKTLVGEGEELWVGVRIRFPSSFSFYTNTGFLKFIRLEYVQPDPNHPTYGRVDWLIENGLGDAQIGWRYGDENQDFGLDKLGGELFVLDEWNWAEVYFKASADPAKSVTRLWVNGFMQYEITEGKNVRNRTSAGTYETSTTKKMLPTLPAATTALESVMLFTYWNGGAPKTQSCNVQDVIIHDNGADLAAKDEFGNKMIGPDAF